MKIALRTVGVLLIVGALVLVNLAIYYSSEPRYAQMGWAIFCGFNAIWIAVLGVLGLCYAESHDVAMRQLDWNERHKASA